MASVCSITEYFQRKIGQVLGTPFLLFGSERVSTDTASEQSTGHSGPPGTLFLFSFVTVPPYHSAFRRQLKTFLYKSVFEPLYIAPHPHTCRWPTSLELLANRTETI